MFVVSYIIEHMRLLSNKIYRVSFFWFYIWCTCSSVHECAAACYRFANVIVHSTRMFSATFLYFANDSVNLCEIWQRNLHTLLSYHNFMCNICMYYVHMQINISIISCDYFSQTSLDFWDTLYVHSYRITYYVAI